MNQKENWIDTILEAENLIGRIQPSEQLLSRLRAIPSQVRESYELVPKKIVWTVAASVALLICLNFFSVKDYKQKTKESISQNEELSENYFSYLKQL